MSWFPGQTERACTPHCAESHYESSQTTQTLCTTEKANVITTTLIFTHLLSFSFTEDARPL